jgi:hypothetical protein
MPLHWIITGTVQSAGHYSTPILWNLFSLLGMAIRPCQWLRWAYRYAATMLAVQMCVLVGCGGSFCLPTWAATALITRSALRGTSHTEKDAVGATAAAVLNASLDTPQARRRPHVRRSDSSSSSSSNDGGGDGSSRRKGPYYANDEMRSEEPPEYQRRPDPPPDDFTSPPHPQRGGAGGGSRGSSSSSKSSKAPAKARAASALKELSPHDFKTLDHAWKLMPTTRCGSAPLRGLSRSRGRTSRCLKKSAR